MEPLDQASEECLAHIAAKRYAEAKEVALNTALWSGSPRLAGRRFGCLGLIANLTQKKDNDLFDGEKLDKLKQMLLRLQSSFDCDEFERGYIEVWLRYIEGSSGDKGVEKDPSKQE
jgi:hypothetical protein